MEFFKANTTIEFMRQRKLAALFSIVIFIASLTALITQGLQLSIEFTGGTTFDVSFSKPVSDLNQLRGDLVKAGFAQASLTRYDTDDISVRIAPHEEWTQTELRAHLMSVLPSGAHIGSLEYIGPSVGKQLMTNGVLAIVLAMLGTMLYIALRFEWRFAVSAAVALVHDPVLILGIFAYFHLEFSLIVLTAVLTVIGYSLNDTIVVYDRVRENFRRMRKGSPSGIMDASINQTLSRTIMTSSLTLVVVIALFLYGGETVHGFALALAIGIVVGTYSSIYVAGSLAISLGLDRKDLMLKPKATVDGMP
ncbi:MAG: protein translocase subunit SecF [Legionellales bacterium]|nr:protein translocase subunit SecF [Legionellales bacterium]HAG61648.1 protein translocase subunit SecF [Coxiellaceae bacterium]